jgi:hypothetical protein
MSMNFPLSNLAEVSRPMPCTAAAGTDEFPSQACELLLYRKANSGH